VADGARSRAVRRQGDGGRSRRRIARARTGSPSPICRRAASARRRPARRSSRSSPRWPSWRRCTATRPTTRSGTGSRRSSWSRRCCAPSRELERLLGKLGRWHDVVDLLERRSEHEGAARQRRRGAAAARAHPPICGRASSTIPRRRAR
jgi:hypothetical protein